MPLLEWPRPRWLTAVPFTTRFELRSNRAVLVLAPGLVRRDT